MTSAAAASIETEMTTSVGGTPSRTPTPAQDDVWGKAVRRTAFLKFCVVSLVTVDVALTAVAVLLRVFSVVHSGDDPHTPAMEAGGLSSDVIWWQLAAEAAEVLLSGVSLYLVLPSFSAKRHSIRERLGVAMFFKVVCCCVFSVGYLAYPGTATLIIGLLGIVLRATEAALLALIIHRINVITSLEEKRPDAVNFSVLQGSSKALPSFLQTLDRLADLSHIRKELHSKMATGRMMWLLFCSAIFVLLVVNSSAQFKSILTNRSSALSPSAIAALDVPSRVDFGHRVNASNRVVLIVVDGLRYDMLSRNPALHSLVTDPVISRDLQLLHMRAQLPSMSVPNWISLITGARPESTGVLGNLLVPETRFDSIFREAKRGGMNRGLTGSPWFGDIVRRTLPWFKGDATIPTTIDEDNKHSADLSDAERFQVAHQALSDTENPYQLFLAHFSDVDAQGHCCGVDVRYNKRDTYQGAVTNKTALITRILQLVGNDTVVLIVSDHGHVDRGGHGGVSEVLVDVPLIVYKKGSNLSSVPPRHPRLRDPGVPKQNVDVAATVCALAGLPTPRHSEGVFADEALAFVPEAEMVLHFRDLFLQKRALVAAFLEAVGQKDELPLDPAADVPSTAPANDTALQLYANAIRSLDALYDHHRHVSLGLQQARNVGLSTMFCVLFVMIGVYVLTRTSFCSPTSWWRRDTDDPISWAGLNRRALFGSALVVFTYLALCIVSYTVIYAAVGYHGWDSTVIHTPEVVPRFILVLSVPGVVFALLLTWSFNVLSWNALVVSRSSRLPPWLLYFLSFISNPSPLVRRNSVVLGSGPVVTESHSDDRSAAASIYLWRHYVLLWQVVAYGVLLVVQGAFAFSLPGMFGVKTITPTIWHLRFRVLTVHLMAIPLFLLSLAMLLSPFSSRVSSSNPSSMDSVYLLKVSKDRDARRKRPERAKLLTASSTTTTVNDSGDPTTYYDLLSSLQGTHVVRLRTHREILKYL